LKEINFTIKKMNLFYIPDIHADTAIMNKNESHHCVKVLRMKSGDEIPFFDGKGTLYKGVLKKVHPEACEVSIISKQENYETRPYFLHIAIAPTKNIDRFEWFLEKATEIGIDRITPLVCDHSERRKIRKDRLERVILSATKQSVKARLPVLDDLVSLNEFVNNNLYDGNNFIAHCGEGERYELITSVSTKNPVMVMIGPEGDFSPQEIELSIKSGLKPVSLGLSRLRTETAGVVVSQILTDLHMLTK
jgi:16S rRNA (uracil1498-N3)-methyltransferase